MRTKALAVALLSLCGVAGCAQSTAREDEEKPELGPELKSLVLDQTPSDLPNPVFIDFGGKVALVGYSIEPAQLAAPGSKLSLKLFWRSTGRLGAGYKLYTQLVTSGGTRFEVDGAGPLRRGALPPDTWELGKIYIDELDVTVPKDLEASRFSVVVGVKTEPVAPAEPEAEAAEAEEQAEQKAEAKAGAGSFGAVYLSVLSGLADDKHGGVVATLETGVVPGAKRARSVKDEKRPAGAMKRPLTPELARPRPRPPQNAQPDQPASP